MSSNNGSNKASNQVFSNSPSPISNKTLKSKKPPVPPKPSTLRAKPIPLPRPMKTLSRIPAINNTKSIIQKFQNQYEELFKLIDNPDVLDYNVSDPMILPYILNPNNQLFEPEELKIKATQLFKSVRYLLYLDQYITFINELKNNDIISLSEYLKEKYYELQIAKKMLPKLLLENVGSSKNTVVSLESSNAIKPSNKPDKLSSVINMYSLEIYNQMLNLINETTKTSRNINGIGFVKLHSIMLPTYTFCKVPEDVIIAFITPLNKFATDVSNKTLFDILNKYKHNQDFLKNPACFLRGNNCFKNTIYYYPGQYIMNVKLSFLLSEITNLEFGFFPDLMDNNLYSFFDKIDEEFYNEIYIDTIFTNYLHLIKNKIIYIYCCRRCDNYIPDLTIEFLYRYEHIITYINLSQCQSIDLDYNNTCSNVYKKVSHIHNKLSQNNSKLDLFYDPVLLSTFKQYTKFKKHIYLGENNDKWEQIFPDIIKNFSDNEFEYFDEILRNFLKKLYKNSNLYSDRIIDIFEQIFQKKKYIFTKYLVKYNYIISNIYYIFKQNMILDKFDILLEIIYDNVLGEDIILELFTDPKIKDDYLFKFYLSKLAITNDRKKKIDIIILNTIKYIDFLDQDLIINIHTLSSTNRIALLEKKIQILDCVNNDDNFKEIFNKTPSSDTENFINLLFYYYSVNNIDGNKILKIYNILSINEHNQIIYMFSPTYKLIYNIYLKQPINQKILELLKSIKSQLLYSILISNNYDSDFLSIELPKKILGSIFIENLKGNLLDYLVIYLQSLFYILIYCSLKTEFIILIIDLLNTILQSIQVYSNLYPTVINLYIYLSILLYKYNYITKSKFILDRLYKTIHIQPIPFCNKHNKTLKKQPNKKSSSSALCSNTKKQIIDIIKKFINNFEAEFVKLNPILKDRPVISHYLKGNFVFDILFN